MLKAKNANELSNSDKERIRELEAKLTVIGRAYAKDNPALEWPGVLKGSPEWNAWREFRQTVGLPCWFMETRDKWTVPTPWPPVDFDAAYNAAKRK